MPVAPASMLWMSFSVAGNVDEAEGRRRRAGAYRRSQIEDAAGLLLPLAGRSPPGGAFRWSCRGRCGPAVPTIMAELFRQNGRSHPRVEREKS